MMNMLLLIVALQGATCFFNTPKLAEVRMLYRQAATEERSCVSLLELLNTYNDKNNTLMLGYKGAITMMMAKYKLNPLAKLAHFNEGKNILQAAIEEDGRNVELRFLRFAAQSSAPSFLGYQDDLMADKRMVLQAFPHIKENDLKEMMAGYLINCGYLSAREKEIVRKI